MERLHFILLPGGDMLVLREFWLMLMRTSTRQIKYYACDYLISEYEYICFFSTFFYCNLFSYLPLISSSFSDVHVHQHVYKQLQVVHVCRCCDSLSISCVITSHSPMHTEWYESTVWSKSRGTHWGSWHSSKRWSWPKFGHHSMRTGTCSFHFCVYWGTVVLLTELKACSVWLARWYVLATAIANKAVVPSPLRLVLSSPHVYSLPMHCSPAELSFTTSHPSYYVG